MSSSSDALPIQRHGRDHFFKYMTADTAAKVMESKQFLWRSPVTFNDPFDHQAGIVLGEFDTEAFAVGLAKALERLIFDDDIAFPPPTTRLLAGTMLMREQRARLPRQQVAASLVDAGQDTGARIHEHLDDFNEEIQRHLVHSRVFCVSEKNDNVVMWSHYADEHRGVVFKLRCVKEIDHPLLIARKVQYADTFIPFPTPERYIRHLTGAEDFDLLGLCWEMPFRKHTDWAYEAEWRIYKPLLEEPPGNGLSFRNEDPRIFEAMYLGCRMNDTEIERISSVARRELPQMRIYRGRRSRRDFSLSFEEITSVN